MKEKLGSYIQQVRGVSYKPSDLSGKPSRDYTILLRANNISRGKINFDSVQYVHNSKVSSEQILRTGDILICSSSGSISLVGKSAMYRKSGDHTFGAFCKVVRVRSGILPRYLAFYMSSLTYRRYIEQISSGTNINNLKNEHFDNILLEVPSLDKQKEIVEKLSRLQKVVDCRYKQLEELDELVKCRFIEMFGEPSNNHKQLPIKPLGELCTVGRGSSPRPISKYITDSEEGINWIKIGDTDGTKYISTTAEKIIQEGTRKSRMVYAGDLLLSNSMSFGHPYILKINGCIHDGWLVLHFDHAVFNALYLQAYLELPVVYAMFESMVAGSVVNNLNREIVKKLPVIISPIERQEHFASFVRRVDKLRFVSAFHQINALLGMQKV